MIQSLRVRGYRGFREYAVDGLARVNLFVGLNNTGKTSLLEAIEITDAPGTAMRSIAQRRGEMALRPEEPESQNDSLRAFRLPGQFLSPNMSGFFHQRALTGDGLEIEVETEEAVQATRIVFDTRQEEDADEPTKLLRVLRSGGPNRVIRIDDAGTPLPSLRGGGTGGESTRSRQSLFVASSSLTERQIEGMYGLIAGEKKDWFVVEAIQILEPQVTGLLFAPYGREGGSGQFFIDDRGGRRLPLGSYGEGTKRLLGLAVALAEVRGRILLLDELDTGIHYSVMPNLWRLLLTASVDFDVQILATSHSADLIQGLQDLIKLEPHFADLAAFHKIERRPGANVAVTFSGERLKRSLSFDLEMR